MAIAPIPRAAVSDLVFTQLVEEILSGRLAPGAALPAERELADSFEVNRHAVREALKRVQQSGLVKIAQGGKTRVQDWRAHAGLDTLVSLAGSGAVPPAKVAGDIAAMRVVLGADAARLCAERATDAQLAEVVRLAAAYPAEPMPAAELAAVDLAFWTAVVDGSGNVAYRLGLNTLAAGIAEIGVAHIANLLEEYADRAAHLELAERIAVRDGAAARSLAERLLASGAPDRC